MYKKIISSCILLMCVLFLSTSTPVQAADVQYNTYSNARFNFGVNYPSNFIKQAESANGDGAIFVSPDNTIKIIASAIRQVATPPLTLDQAYNDKARKLAANDENVIFDGKVKADSFVLSWQTDNAVHHLRQALTPSIIYSLTIDIATKNPTEHKQLVYTITSSFYYIK